MSLNSEFESGAISYCRSLFGSRGLLMEVDDMNLYRLGDVYYGGNHRLFMFGLVKESYLKEDLGMGMDLFSYNNCRDMNFFKYVSTLSALKDRRKMGYSRRMYNFMYDDSLGGYIDWSGSSDLFFSMYVRDCLYGSCAGVSDESLGLVFNGLYMLYGGNGVYDIVVQKFLYGGSTFVRVKSLYWVVVLCLSERYYKCRKIDLSSYDSSIGINDVEHNMKQDVLFKGLRI